MPAFVYFARDADGQAVEGVLEAASASLAAAALQQRGVVPVRVAPQPPPAPTWRERIFGPGRLGDRDLSLLTQQLHTLLRGGVPVIGALQAIGRSSASRAIGKLVADVGAALNEGLELSQALARRRDVFDNFYLAMVRVGETAGRLPEVFKALHEHLEFQRTMREQVAAALRYPKFVVMAMIVAVAVLNVFVIPTFAQVFANAKVALPIMTRVLLATSDFFVRQWPLLLGASVCAWAAWRTWVRTERGALWWDRHQLRLPLAGRILLVTALARICRSLQMTLASGVPLILGLALAADVAGNRFLSRRLQRARQGVERGESLLVACGQTGIFTPLVLQMIAVGEETGRVDELLGEIAAAYRQDVENELKALSQRIEPVLITILGAMVLVLALGVFVPMWDLGKAVR